MILVITVMLTRYRSDCGSPSGAGFYACEVGKTWTIVIRVVSGVYLCRYIIKFDMCYIRYYAL